MGTGENVVSTRTFEQLVELAAQLAEADQRLRYQLVKARRDAGLSQRDVADALGIKQSSVAAFERHDNDPRLSTIRRYALAVGVRVQHRVTCEERDSGWMPVRPERPVDFGLSQPARQFALAGPVRSTDRRRLAA